MSVFREFEKKLESLFEGVFLRAFKSGVHPVELGKKLVRELEGHKTIGVSGVYVPNRYEVGLSDRDYSRFESYQAVMARELENLLVSYIRDKGYRVLDRPRIKLLDDSSLREGDFWIGCRIEGELPADRRPGREPPAEERRAPVVRKVLPKKKRLSPACPPGLELIDSGSATPFFTLENDIIRIGRSEDNDLVLPDPNVSRSHLEIERRGDSYFIRDLESKNGTWLNEERVSEAALREDDVIRLGTTRLVFRRSTT